MASGKEEKLIDFDNDLVNPGDSICVHDFINESWKSATAQEIDLDEREILVQYEDRSQEWIRIDGTKICFPPPPIPEIKKPAPSIPENKAVRSQNLRSASRSRTLLERRKQCNKNIVKEKTETSSEEKLKTTSDRKGSDVLKSMSPSFPKLKFVQKTEMNRHDSNRNRKTSKPSGKGSEGDKDSNKIKIRFGKTSDFNNLIRKKSKSDLYDDPNEEMSVVISDEKLPPGWSKHKVKRPNSSKWDVILQNEEEKKFRSRAEIQAYYERRNEPYPEDAFDFCSGKRPPVSKSSTEKNSEVDISETLPFLNNKKKIKTLLPRRSLAETPCTTPVSSKEVIADDSSIRLTVAVTPFQQISDPLSPLVLSSPSGSSGYTCPKQNCGRQFRTENRLIMHIRHYHAEYKNMLRSMPNVADLAYARTVGESIDTPQTSCLEKIAKLEEDKMKEKTETDGSIIDEDFSLAIDDDNEEKSQIDSTPKSDAAAKAKLAKKSTPVKKTPSTPSSPSSSVLLAQLKQPPLVPPTISIQSEHTDAEISVSQNNPIAFFSPNVSNKDLNFNKSSPLSDTDEKKKSAQSRKRGISQLEDEEIINCICGYGFEDGLMLECELCGFWQHGVCNAVESEDDTQGYICYMCQNPRRVHSSKKFSYVQNWLKDGKIPKFEFSKTTDEVMEERRKLIQQIHEFMSRLTELQNAVHSLKVKTHILRQTPDHPKLYLWAKSWDDRKSEEKEDVVTSDGGPVPEAAINMADCRKHLSEHIDEEMDKVEIMLEKLEEEIDKLEDDEDFKHDPDKLKSVAKQTLLMMIRDLASIQNLKYC